MSRAQKMLDAVKQMNDTNKSWLANDSEHTLLKPDDELMQEIDLAIQDFGLLSHVQNVEENLEQTVKFCNLESENLVHGQINILESTSNSIPQTLTELTPVESTVCAEDLEETVESHNFERNTLVGDQMNLLEVITFTEPIIVDSTVCGGVANARESPETETGFSNNIMLKPKLEKQRRVQGLNYIGCKRKGNDITVVPKKSRKMKKRCFHTNVHPKTARTFLCGQFSEEDRTEAFKKFWKIESWPEKKMFIKTLVTTRKVVRRRKIIRDNLDVKKRKGAGHDIYFPKADGFKVRVCRNFFINTLGIGEDTFKRWTKRDFDKDEAESEEQEDEDPLSSKKQVTKRQKKKKGVLENNMNIWLDSVPKVPSHYCRSTSKKTYVEPLFRSMKHLHEVYTEWCLERKVTAAGRTLFTNFLKKKNVAIHMPRKDQCDICCGYKAKQISEEAYQNHIRKKDEARLAKNTAKESASEEKLVFTMDLQSVLLCPKLLASKVYYKQKLQIHNFTIYSLNNKNVCLYVWHEGMGGVSCNEFTSCVVDFISNANKNYKHVTVISDGCCHQNRNKVLASALSDVAVKKKIIIEQLYLEKGHTMMEADSVHATLEKYFIPPINSPSDYVARMRAARPAHPYDVHVVDFSFFKNYEKIQTNLPSLRPGKNRAGDPVVTDIRALKYLPTGTLTFLCSIHFLIFFLR